MTAEQPLTEKLAATIEVMTNRPSMDAYDLAILRLAEAKDEIEKLTRRLTPGQGEEYANEVERLRYVVVTQRTAIERLRATVEHVQEWCVGAGLWGVARMLDGTDGTATPAATLSYGNVATRVCGCGCHEGTSVHMAPCACQRSAPPATIAGVCGQCGTVGEHQCGGDLR
jgi:hypothetical protein